MTNVREGHVKNGSNFSARWCSPHGTLICKVIGEKNPQPSIHRVGLIAWLEWSPDMTLLVLFILRSRRNYVLFVQIQSLYHTKDRIEQEIAAVSTKPVQEV